MLDRITIKDGDYVVTTDGAFGVAWEIGSDDDEIMFIPDADDYEDGMTTYLTTRDNLMFVGRGEFTAGDRVQIDDSALQCDGSEPVSDAITGTVLGVYNDRVAVVMDDFESLEDSIESMYFKRDVTKLV